MPRSYLTVDENGKSNITIDENGHNKLKGASDVFGQGEATVLGNTDWDAINNPITAFNFVLEVELVYFLPLRSIRAFTKENEYEYIREGGVNDYVHMKRKPISKPFTFQVERYIGTERFLDPLATGTELILPLILYLYRHKARGGFTDAAPAAPARIYIFTGCTVMGKEYGELNAEKSGLVTETTTIAYRELIVIPNPKQSASESEEWNFKDNKYSKGKGYKNKYAASNPKDNIEDASYDYTWTDGGELIRKNTSPGYKAANFLTKENQHKYLPKWVREANKYASDKTYKVETDNKGVTTVTRNDTGILNRPQYQMKVDGVKPKNIKANEKDSEKPKQIGPYSYKKDGTKNIAARTSGVDDKKPKQVGPYSYKKDGTKNIAAKPSGIDDKKPPQVGPYSYKKDGTKNIAAKTSGIDDNKPAQVGPYSVGKDGSKNIAARTSGKDSEKPVQVGPYKYSSTGTGNVAAKSSPKDSEKPVQVGPYSVGKDKTKNVAAKASPIDKEKPKKRGPYSIKNGTKNTAGIAVSPKDNEKSPVTIYPPSRRALMAEALKKNKT